MSSILLALLATQTPTQARIIEMPDPTADRVVVQAMVRLEPQGSRTLAAFRVAVEALPYGTIGHPRHRLIQYGGLAGQGIRISLSEGFFCIGVTAPKGSLDIAADLIAELLQKPLFAETDVNKILEEMPFRKRTGWEVAFDSRGLDLKGLTIKEVGDTFRKVVSPERTTIVVTGAFDSGEGVKEVELRLINWPKIIRPKIRPLESVIPPVKANSGLAAVTLFEGPELLPGQWRQAVAAAYLLGVGKGSSVFRIVREQENISYRQEAAVLLTPKGFRLAVFYACKPREDLNEVATKVKEALLKDIDSWTQADLDRAISIADGPVRQGILSSPVMATLERTLRFTLEDRAFWTGLIAGNPALNSLLKPNESKVMDALLVDPNSNLAEIKELAGNSLRDSGVRIVDGP